MTALHIEERDGGVCFSVRAAPGAHRDGIVGRLGTALKIAVTAAPERGKANQRILAVLARVLGVPGRSIMLVSGSSSRDKKVLVRDLSRAQVLDRLAPHLDH